MMKNAVLLVTVASFVIFNAHAMTKEEEANYQQLVNKCRSKFPIADDVLRGLHATGSLRDENDEAALCYVNCVMEGMEIVKNGQFQSEEQKKVAERVLAGVKRQDGSAYNIEAVKKDIEECSKLRGRSVCQTNYKITQCIEKKRRQSY